MGAQRESRENARLHISYFAPEKIGGPLKAMLVRCPHCAAIIHLEDAENSPSVVTCWMCTSVIEARVRTAGNGPATLTSPSTAARERPSAIGLSDTFFPEAHNPELSAAEQIKIRVVSGLAQGQEFELTKSITTIGRLGGGADLEINDPEVSRLHCAVEVRRDGILLHDLRSLNGTYLRNSRVSVARLGPAAKFRIGASELQIHTT
jgi:Inner membrane component of T3SS, cytoplasmic domain